MVLPDEDQVLPDALADARLTAYMLGGRAAEEMVFHDPTTGAGNDIEKATNVARAMVTQFGMTERLGAHQAGRGQPEPFLGATSATAQLLRGDRRDRRRGDQEVARDDGPPGGLSRSWRRTATSPTPWSPSSSTRRPWTRSRSPASSEPLRRRPSARPGPGPTSVTLLAPAGRDPAVDPGPHRGPEPAERPQRGTSPREEAGAVRPRPVRAVTSTATPGGWRVRLGARLPPH